MTNALILGLLWLLMYYSNIEHQKLFVFMWWVAIFFNTFAGEKWR